ncbi:DedA family protein [Cryptosporangium sp. NPDC048952]|uniref:DedA family protein n=1 Tax=Cryptosporangium sp. NPDC048952 TaxID=3363961 RepID=UPI0037184A3A
MLVELLASPAVYPLLFGLTLLDGFIPVVPSESAVIAAGSFAASGQPALVAVVLVAAVGAFVGDHVAYGIGRLLPRRHPRDGNAPGRPAGRVGKYVGRLMDRASGDLGRRAGVVILTGRFIPCGRLAVTLACGAGRYPLRRFTTWTALATTAWAVYTTLIGYLGGALFADTPWLGMLTGLSLGLVVSAVLGAGSRRRRRTPTTPSDEPLLSYSGTSAAGEQTAGASGFSSAGVRTAAGRCPRCP